jgi:hypothetical protein
VFPISEFMKLAFPIMAAPTKKAKKLAGKMVSERYGVY